MACTNLFCFLKSKNMRIQRRGLNKQRAQTKIFWPEKRRYCVLILFKEKRVFLCVEKVDNRKEKMLQKKEKKVMEKRRFWWCLRPCGSSHKTFLTEHAVWFFTELSEGLSFFSFDLNGEKKANASRQGHRPPYWFSASCRRVTVPRHAAHTSSEHSNVWKLCVDAHYPTGPNKAKHFPTAVCPISLAPCLSRRQVIENHDSTVTSFQWIYFHSETLQGCIHVALVIWQIRFLVSLDWFFVQALLDISSNLVWQSLMYFSWMTRAAVTLSASLLVSSSKSLSCFSIIFCF